MKPTAVIRRPLVTEKTTVAREGSTALLKVADNGMGIAPGLMPTIFDLFVQGERTLARSEGGLGVGLTLVRRLVELHGGSISAVSDGPGKGTEFVVRLPCGDGQPGSNEHRPASPAGNGPRRWCSTPSASPAAGRRSGPTARSPCARAPSSA